MKMSRLRLAALAVAFTTTSAGLVAGLASPATAAAVCASGVPGDVNGDGHAEVALTDRNRSNSGTVHVLYGQTGGLVTDPQGTALDDQHLHQDSPGVPGVNEGDDEFGSAVEFADLNGDGCADLAVGVPVENSDRGRVVVIPGSPAGLRTTEALSINESSLFGPGAGAAGEGFGATLAAADLDGDGVDDLAVGVPGEQVERKAAGAVAVVYGSAAGLGAAKPAALVSQASPGVPGTAEEEDSFGAALAPGDFDGNGTTDLAVGAPGENGYGAVLVLPGATGAPLGATGSKVFSQRTAGVPGAAEQNDFFGASLAAGDVTADGRDDLAVGIPDENSDPDPERERLGQGAVVMLLGSATGVTTTGSQLWSQASPGVDGKVGNSDLFGRSLVVAPLDADGYADLAVAAPFDSVGSAFAAGSVTMLRGSAGGLTTDGAGGSRVHQDTPGVASRATILDFFGYSISAAAVQSPRQHNLIVGAPLDGIAGEQVGRAHQLAIGADGPSGLGSRSFHHDTPGLKGRPGGGFGTTVR